MVVMKGVCFFIFKNGMLNVWRGPHDYGSLVDDGMDGDGDDEEVG